MSGDIVEAAKGLAQITWYAPEAARGITKTLKRLRGTNPEFGTPESSSLVPFGPMPPPRSRAPSSRKRSHVGGEEEEYLGAHAPLRVPAHAPSGLPRGLAQKIRRCCLQQKASFTSQANTQIPNSGLAVVCLNDMSQGTADGDRIANEILNVKLIIRGYCSIAGTVTLDAYRLMVMLDRECYGNLCTYAQVLEAVNYLSPFNFEAKERFVPLFDHSFAMINRSTPATISSGDLKLFDIVIPLRFRTTYTGDAGTISDIVKNSLCLMQISIAGNVYATWNAELVYESG